jgi:hypothetical protein
MPDNEPPQSSIILYQTEDGRTRIQCRFENQTIWLNQLQIAELFQTTVPNINLHLKALYGEGELSEGATIKSYLIVRSEGPRQVSRKGVKPGIKKIDESERSKRGKPWTLVFSSFCFAVVCHPKTQKGVDAVIAA